MKCPQCNTENYCPCEVCLPRERDKLPKWKWVEGELIVCGKCGYMTYADIWEEKEYKEWKRKEKK